MIKTGFLLALALIFSVVVLESSEGPDSFGVISNFESTEIVAKIKELGVGWVRSTAYWHEIETSKGNFDWTKYDAIVDRAREAGVNMFITLEGTPKWANGNKAVNDPPEKKEDFADFAHAIASRYSDRDHVKAYGLWNEPNLERFWKGSSREFIEKIVVPGATGIRKAKQSLIVAGPELSHHWIEDSNWNLDRFLNLPNADFDVITLHFYPANEKPNPRVFLDYLENKVRKKTGNKPVWITEISTYGCANKTVTLKYQAIFFAIIVDLQKQKSDWFKKLFAYRLWDPQGKCDNESGFGLTYGEKVTEKPAFEVYRNKIRGIQDP